MGVLKYIAAVFCMLITTTAQADWQHTKWGQSLQSLLDMDEYEVEATPEYQVLSEMVDEFGYNFGAFGYPVAFTKITEKSGLFVVDAVVIFLTFDEQLSGVVIAVSPPPDILPILLRDRYGVPETQWENKKIRGAPCEQKVMFWRDTASGNNIRLIETNCSGPTKDSSLLIYSPILTAENSPL